MSLALFYASITFLAGIIALLTWLYLTADNARSGALLLKSVQLFVLPGVVLTAVLIELHALPIAMWVGVLVEESMKAIAASTERNRSNRFCVVVLFGIWELTLVKPLPGLFEPTAFSGLSNIEGFGLIATSMVAILMHAVTAEIYAAAAPTKLVIALFFASLLHMTFNISINLFGMLLLPTLLQVALLILLFVALWRKFHLSFQQTGL